MRHGSHTVPSLSLVIFPLAGTIGFALRKVDIPGLGPFLTRLVPNLSSPDSDPFMKELQIVLDAPLSLAQEGNHQGKHVAAQRS